MEMLTDTRRRLGPSLFGLTALTKSWKSPKFEKATHKNSMEIYRNWELPKKETAKNWKKCETSRLSRGMGDPHIKQSWKYLQDLKLKWKVQYGKYIRWLISYIDLYMPVNLVSMVCKIRIIIVYKFNGVLYCCII